MTIRSIVFAALSMILACSSHAQIQVWRGNSLLGTFASGDPISLVLGEISGETTLRIFDGSPASTGPQHSVGKITLDGHLASSGGRLSILVASGVTAIPTTPAQGLIEGLADFGTANSAGLDVRDDDNSGNRTLRDHTRLALAITGDIRGTIDVGQVFRIQADGVFNGNTWVSGGQLLGDVIASAKADDTAVTNVEIIYPPETKRYFAAEYLRFGRGILGNISTVGGFLEQVDLDRDHDIWHLSSIRRVIVGSHDSPIGIQGDITADNGMIGVINTTGPIGAPATGATPERRVLIRAAAGIDEVRAVDYAEADTESDYLKVAKPLDFHADILTKYNFPRAGLRVKGLPSRDSPLRLIQTNGGFYGSITAANIVSTGRGNNPNFHSGILVRGVIDAPINVDYVVSKCDIMGWTFTSPITVGVMYQGIIIAHGRDDPNPPSGGPTPGFIPSIDIGNRAFTPHTAWTTGNAPPYALFAKGLCGARGISVTGLFGVLPGVFGPGFPASAWHFGYTPDFWLYGFCGNNNCARTPVLGTGDSLIRATQINTIAIKQMRILDDGNTIDKKTPPRIEALVIGSLSVGDLREGVIWSGAYQWNTQFLDPANAPNPFLSGNPDRDFGAQVGVRQCQYDPTHDYTSIVSATVGCVGHWGHVWFQDCSHFNVLRSCLGGLHVPVLNASQTIWIGDRLGREVQHNEEFCSCIENDPPLPNPAQTPQNPYDFVRCFDCSDARCAPFPDDATSRAALPQTPLWMRRGLISVGDHLAGPPGDQAIRGQIILNGANHPLSHVGDDGLPVEDRRWEGKVTTGITHPRLLPSVPTDRCTSNDLTPLPDVAVKPVDDDPIANPMWDTSAPYYLSKPSDLGGTVFTNAGRAVGLAPFHLHENGCIPPNNQTCKLAGVVESAFNSLSAVPIIIEHYGPIMKLPAGATWKSCVKIEAQPLHNCPSDSPPGPATVCNWFALDTAFVVRGPGDAGWTRPNAIGISRASGVYPKAGIYRVSLAIAPNTGLPKIRCKDVIGNPPVVWPLTCAPLEDNGSGDSGGGNIVAEDFSAYSYIFKIAPDCDYDGYNDQDPAHPSNCVGTCQCDINHDHMVSVTDIFEFLRAWFAGCAGQTSPECEAFNSTPNNPIYLNADFNGGGISVQDIFDFLSAWFASGGLTGC